MVRYWWDVFPQRDFEVSVAVLIFATPADTATSPPPPTPPHHIINVVTITCLCPKANIPTVNTRLSHTPSTSGEKLTLDWPSSTTSYSKSPSAWVDVPKPRLSNPSPTPTFTHAALHTSKVNTPCTSEGKYNDKSYILNLKQSAVEFSLWIWSEFVHPTSEVWLEIKITVHIIPPINAFLLLRHRFYSNSSFGDRLEWQMIHVIEK